MVNPEHVKLQAVADRSQAIGEFLEWLDEQDIALSEIDRYTKYLTRGWRLPIVEPRDKLIARFFGIDLVALETEKRAMLAELQVSQ